jgi:hypothetical protein
MIHKINDMIATNSKIATIITRNLSKIDSGFRNQSTAAPFPAF